MVILNFLVDERGRVVDSYVVRSSHRIFEEPAVDALWGWLFSPGMRDGKPVVTRMQIPIAFKISQ